MHWALDLFEEYSDPTPWRDCWHPSYCPLPGIEFVAFTIQVCISVLIEKNQSEIHSDDTFMYHSVLCSFILLISQNTFNNFGAHLRNHLYSMSVYRSSAEVEGEPTAHLDWHMGAF